MAMPQLTATEVMDMEDMDFPEGLVMAGDPNLGGTNSLSTRC